MRTAIISDIHGHLPGLEIVLQDLNNRQIDRIICLGDLVEGGEENDEVVQWMKNNQIVTVRGNHDEINECYLQKDNQKWLAQIPEEIVEDEIIFMYISPRPKQLPITNEIEAWNVFEEKSFRLCFIGHLHFPALYGYRCEFFAESQPYPVSQGRYDLDPSDRFIICFGAIGYPRSGGKFIRYGIFDDRQYAVEFIALAGELLPYGLGLVE